MKANYTDITLVLDRSGSMGSVRSDTIGGVNLFVDGQKKVPGEATFSLYQFNDYYEPIRHGVPIKEVEPLTEINYFPAGNTCLYGAIGCAIRDTGERLKALPEDQRPGKVVFVIVTDGLENSSHIHEWSRKHTAASIKADIERQRGTYKWEFVFIGADQDAIGNAVAMGAAASHALNYTKNKQGTEEAYKGLTDNLRSLRVGATMNMSWSADQHKAQEDAAFLSKTD